MPRRIQIRPPRSESNINVSEAWQSTLEPAIIALLSREGSIESDPKLEYIHLYKSVYKLVLQGSLNVLQRRLRETFNSYLGKKYATMQRANLLTPITEVNVLAEISNFWRYFNERVRLVRDIFLYADRDTTSSVPKTQIISNTEFRDNFVNPLLGVLTTQFTNAVSMLRDGQDVDVGVLNGTMDMLFSVSHESEPSSENPDINQTNFEGKVQDAVVADSRRYFTDKLQQMRSRPVIEQLEQISKWLDYETAREGAGSIYWPRTAEQITEYIDKDLLTSQLPLLTADRNTGLWHWIESDNVDAIKLAYSLERRTSLHEIAGQVASHLAEEQSSGNKTYREMPTEWVELTAQLVAKYDRIAELVDKENLLPQIKEAHQECVSSSDRSTDLLANYLDSYLKKSSQVEPEQVSHALELGRTVYSLLQDRDEFTKIYQRLLARRLLNNSSRSMQLEGQWIRIMNEEDQGDYTHNFEKMIKDIEVSREQFHGSDAISPGIIPTNVDVLSSNLWPKVMQPHLKYTPTLPSAITEAKTEFEQFYGRLQDDRQLTWNYNLSNADVKIRVGSKSYIASVPLICLSILDLFGGDEDDSSESEEPSYTTEQIAQMTGIPPGGELERHLKSLYLVPGSQLLVKTPESKEVLLQDSFKFNTNFSSPKPRIKIKVVSAKSGTSQKLAPEDSEMLNQERAEKLQATLMRIMKANQRMEHTALVPKTAQSLHYHFRATQPQIKREIDALLGRGYLQRDPENERVYCYVP